MPYCKPGPAVSSNARDRGRLYTDYNLNKFSHTLRSHTGMCINEYLANFYNSARHRIIVMRLEHRAADDPNKHLLDAQFGAGSDDCRHG